MNLCNFIDFVTHCKKKQELHIEQCYFPSLFDVNVYNIYAKPYVFLSKHVVFAQRLASRYPVDLWQSTLEIEFLCFKQIRIGCHYAKIYGCWGNMVLVKNSLNISNMLW